MIRIGDYLGAKYEYTRYYLPFVVKTGIKFCDWKQAKEMLMIHPYENFTNFLPTKGGLMVDIGSQYSDWSIIAAKKYGSNVIGFEASAKNWKIGLQNIALNKMNARIVSHNYAIGKLEETVQAHFDGNMISKTEHGETESIKMISLDSIHFTNPPDLIKIDIEGFEYEALEGMAGILDTYHPRIVIETHTTELLKSCSAFLSSVGYEEKHRNLERRGKLPFDLILETFWRWIE